MGGWCIFGAKQPKVEIHTYLDTDVGKSVGKLPSIRNNHAKTMDGGGHPFRSRQIFSVHRHQQKQWKGPFYRPFLPLRHFAPYYTVNLTDEGMGEGTASFTCNKQFSERLRESGTDFVFPGDRHDQLSNMAPLMLLRRMGHAEITVHGFRSTFRDWVAELTNIQGEVAEAALAHGNADETEAAYLRSNFFKKRVGLMNVWADYCSMVQPDSNVTPLRSRSVS